MRETVLHATVVSSTSSLSSLIVQAATADKQQSGYRRFREKEPFQFAWKSTPPPWVEAETREGIEIMDTTLPYTERTHAEFFALMRWLAPSEAETQVRLAVHQEVVTILQQVDPNIQVDIFGSLMYGVALPVSDMDMNVTSSSEGLLSVEKLGNVLRATGLYYKFKVLRKARVPLVKCTHRRSATELDFTISNNSGRITGHVAREYFERFPAARPLVVFLKYFLRQRGLEDVSLGGLSSYSICLMVFSYFQNRPLEKKVKGYGQLLLEFLYLYGYDFNHRRLGIDVARQRYVPKPPTIPAEHLYIVDPADEKNNVSRATKKYDFIYRSFRIAHTVLTTVFPPNIDNCGSLFGRLLRNDTHMISLRRYMCSFPVAQYYPAWPIDSRNFIPSMKNQFFASPNLTFADISVFPRRGKKRSGHESDEIDNWRKRRVRISENEDYSWEE